MAYLQDPGTLLSGATFGKGAFGGQRSIFFDGGTYTEDPKTGDWFLSSYTEPTRGDMDFGQAAPPPPQRLSADQVNASGAGFSGWLTGEGLESIVSKGHSKEALLTQDNIKVVGRDEKTGGYLVMSKTGDKTGSVYAVMPTPDGSYMSAGVVQNNVPFDTNSPWWKEALPIIMVAAGPLFAYGGQVVSNAVGALANGTATTISQALQIGVEAANAAGAVTGAAATFPTGVADPFTLANATTGTAVGAVNPLYDLSQGNSLLGPGTKATVGLGVPESMTNTALIPSSFAPQTGLNLTGVNSFADPFTIGSLPTQTQTNWGIPPGGYPGANIPPGGGLDPKTGLPTGPTPDTFPPGGGPPTGADTNLPKPPIGAPPGSPGGTNQPSGSDPWRTLLTLADMYNKYAMGNNVRDTMEAWSNKIFGKSADFENNLMNTYQNPQAYYGGPEFTALRDIVSGRENRTASNLGRLTNPTVPDYVTTKALVENMNQYRTGLANSANIGRAASGEAMRGMGQALGGQGQAASWYTPATFNAGNSGSNNPLQTINNTAGAIKDFWNWGNNIWNNGNFKWPWED